MKPISNKIKRSILFMMFSVCTFLVSSGFDRERISIDNLELTSIPVFSSNFIACNLSKPENTILRKDSLIWSAVGFTKISKDRSIIKLQGNAKFKCDAFSIMADEIIINKNTEKVFAKNFTILAQGTDSLTKGTFGEFSLHKK